MQYISVIYRTVLASLNLTGFRGERKKKTAPPKVPPAFLVRMRNYGKSYCYIYSYSTFYIPRACTIANRDIII